MSDIKILGKKIFGYEESELKKYFDGQHIIYELPTGGTVKIKLNRKERRKLSQVKIR